jgi:hypothetical protein
LPAVDGSVSPEWVVPGSGAASHAALLFMTFTSVGSIADLIDSLTVGKSDVLSFCALATALID